MMIKKEGIYKLNKNCLGLMEGHFITVTKINEFTDYMRTTIHVGWESTKQPVKLIRDLSDAQV